jgi:AGCS family alanine or glycine:cation symporter
LRFCSLFALFSLQAFLEDLSGYIWWPVLFLIIGGGLFFMFYSRFIHFRHFKHAIDVLRGKYDDPNAPGQISAYKALSTALASTVGIGNLSGVATAIALGGPGALFWMWVTSIIGMSTNFFTSTLASLYRGKDSNGEVQGGPMYVIREALGKRWQPWAVMFCLCCMVGALPIYQANQLTQAIYDIGLGATPLAGLSPGTWKVLIGVVLCAIASAVIVGGIQRIGNWAGRLVPIMIVLHFASVMIILVAYADRVPRYLAMIFEDAFAAHHYHGQPFLGGMLGGIIMLGVRRATFSNEAGIGTAPMAMGAAKSSAPIQEGMASMLSPVIDTIVSCTLTALAILVTDVWQTSKSSGITLTAEAYAKAMPLGGHYVLLLCTLVFGISALFSYSYYGRKALAFLIGERYSASYDYFYLTMIVVGAVASMETVLYLIDIAFALMAVPTMITGMMLAPKVMAEARRYFEKGIYKQKR